MTNQLPIDCESMNHHVTCPACKYPEALAALMLNGRFTVSCTECGYGQAEMKFLESQQQPTDTVPAVSPVAEARPELCIACDHPRTKVQNGDEAAFYPTICPKCGLDFDRDVFDYSPESDDVCSDLMGFFTILGKVANFDESWQRTFYENLLSNSYIPVASPFDASLRLVLTVISDTHDQLSTRPLEVNCFCPACDYDLATATKDHEADFYHVTCSVCSLDRDFDSVELSTESVDKEAF